MEKGSVRNAALVLPDRVCRGGIRWQDGIIKEIFLEDGKTLANDSAPDMEEDLLIPGLIDTHVHGAGGYDVMDATPESLAAMAWALLKEGTTAFLPTTMSCLPHHLSGVLQNVADYGQGELNSAEILGVHMEGPFIATEFKGAQAMDSIWPLEREGAAEFLNELLNRFSGLVKILTLAPERPYGRALVEVCQAHGVISSAGHTAADFNQMEEAQKWGVHHVTHAFNAMPGIHHRNPGLLTRALLDDTVTLELIADGVHLHPSVVQLTLNAKAQNRVCLVSDGTRAMGMPEGEYELGGQRTLVYQGLARLIDGTIAGSAYPLRQGLKMLVKELHYPLPDAVRYVTSNPAQLLGIDDRVGSLAIDKEATFVRLSPDFDVKEVWVQGQQVFVERG